MRAGVVCPLLPALLAAVAASAAEPPDIRLFFEAASRDEARARDALDRISRSWRDPYAALAVDLARFMPAPPRPAAAPVESEAPAPPDGEARGARGSGAIFRAAARSFRIRARASGSGSLGSWRD